MYKINKYWHKCKSCGNKNGEYHLKQTGPHYGLYCSVCGQWVKWVKQNEMLHIMGNKNINKIYDKDYNKTTVYKAMNLDEPIPLNKCRKYEDLTPEEQAELPF